MAGRKRKLKVRPRADEVNIRVPKGPEVDPYVDRSLPYVDRTRRFGRFARDVNIAPPCGHLLATEPRRQPNAQSDSGQYGGNDRDPEGPHLGKPRGNLHE
jgi:hypothetical protein